MVMSHGIHFGHDSSIASIYGKNGQNIDYLSMERIYRCKHMLGIPSNLLSSKILTDNSESCINISSTQQVPVFIDPDQLHIEIEKSRPIEFKTWLDSFPKDYIFHKYTNWNNGEIQKYTGNLVEETVFGWLHPSYAGAEKSHSRMEMIGPTPNIGLNNFSLTGRIFDKKKNKHKNINYIQHHYLHAMYAAAAGMYNNQIIVTCDGGIGPSYAGGGIYFFDKDLGLSAITPINGWVSLFYDTVGMKLGFSHAEAAGKLMGLAPYGRPLYFDNSWVGTFTEILAGNTFEVKINNWLASIGINNQNILSEWDKNCLIPPKLIADIAASAQLIVEVNQIRLIEVAEKIAIRRGFKYESISMAGGTALNCPANSNILSKYPSFTIPPAVNDEGLSLASAVLGWRFITDKWPDVDLSNPFLGGLNTEEEVMAAASKHMWKKFYVEPIQFIVENVINGAIVGVLSGRSEVGPRALGHRSLIADPTSISTWGKVNSTKRREMWRPLAPAVTHDSSNEYFSHGPENSRYMLFNFQVINKSIPAVTHFDHSSRVQHVQNPDELIHRIMTKLKESGRPPVLLNTSFNGPGVPIVETAMDAFEEANKLNINFIITDFGVFGKK